MWWGGGSLLGVAEVHDPVEVEAGGDEGVGPALASLVAVGVALLDRAAGAQGVLGDLGGQAIGPQ